MYLSCILMALVYIHNTTWIHMLKQCVVFLRQTVTSKYTPLDAHWQLGLTIIIHKPKIVMKCQTIVPLCTFSILMCLPTSPYSSHKHLRTAKINTFRPVTLTHAAGCLRKLTSQETSCIHYSVHVIPTPTTVLSRMNPIHHTFPHYFLKIHFNIILTNKSSSSK